jgi:hypothetical protein
MLETVAGQKPTVTFSVSVANGAQVLHRWYADSTAVLKARLFLSFHGHGFMGTTLTARVHS